MGVHKGAHQGMCTPRPNEITVPPEEEPGVPQFEQRGMFDEGVEEGEPVEEEEGGEGGL